jgi:hypothetical protein
VRRAALDARVACRQHSGVSSGGQRTGCTWCLQHGRKHGRQTPAGSRARSANWKERNAALEELEGLLRAAGGRIQPPPGELVGALKVRPARALPAPRPPRPRIARV